MLRRINLSAAIIILVCFFLPWVQLSCGGDNESFSGFKVARQDDTLLWLIPLLMGAVLVFVLVRMRAAKPHYLGALSAFAGAIVVFLMNRERTRAHNSTGLIALQLTGWFWLGLFAAVVLVVTGIAILLRRQIAPEIGSG